ncbi:helix-turn-helix domain-containing protein [Streptomyces sp. NPDC008240]|uniref:helix-turn-helix domain-containing protein n=1 Tax=Streptomyces sp. NPDC008240 TaxID=3364822 RepID=UPI0036F0A9C5
MARPEASIDHTVPELGRLASHLRSMRHAAGLRYADLADRSGYSAAALKRAASGKSLPIIGVAFSYAVACVAVTMDAEAGRLVPQLHEEAKNAVTQAKLDARKSTVVPKPQYARDLADLSGAMRDAWRRMGEPSSRGMERAGGGHLPRTTANVITHGRTVPRDFRQYVAFLMACGVAEDDPADWLPWMRAWFKIRGRPAWREVRSVSVTLPGTAQLAYWHLLVQESDDPEAAWSEVSDISQSIDGAPHRAGTGTGTGGGTTEWDAGPPPLVWESQTRRHRLIGQTARDRTAVREGRPQATKTRNRISAPHTVA